MLNSPFLGGGMPTNHHILSFLGRVKLILDELNGGSFRGLLETLSKFYRRNAPYSCSDHPFVPRPMPHLSVGD